MQQRCCCSIPILLSGFGLLAGIIPLRLGAAEHIVAPLRGCALFYDCHEIGLLPTARRIPPLCGGGSRAAGYGIPITADLVGGVCVDTTAASAYTLFSACWDDAGVASIAQGNPALVALGFAISDTICLTIACQKRTVPRRTWFIAISKNSVCNRSAGYLHHVMLGDV